MGSFKDINVDIGLFIAFCIGVITIVTLSFGVLSWLDDRITNNVSSSVVPIEKKVNELEAKFDNYDNQRKREYKEIIRLMSEERGE